MSPFFLALLTVTLAEFGDKSQLITLYLAGLHHRKRHIVMGMIAASLLNHYVAAWAGVALHEWLNPRYLSILSGIVFVVVGIFSWQHEDAQKLTVFQKPLPPLVLCFLLYFVAEAADKTQFATAALAAYHQNIGLIVFGAMLGMVIANLPVIYLGRQFGKRVPLDKLKKITAVLFVAIGIFMLISVFL